MKNLLLILFVMSVYLGLAWANQDRPVFDLKTKKLMRSILNKINESEQVHKINEDKLFNSSQAGLVPEQEPTQAFQDSLNSSEN